MIRPLDPGVILRARYRIVKMVGQGGMGAIYQAEDLRLEGRQCAVKETAPDSDADPTVLSQAQEQFYREASILAGWTTMTCPRSPTTSPKTAGITW